MRHVIKYLVIMIVALILGSFTAWLGVFKISHVTYIKNGAWRINTAIGSREVDIYTRAYVAAKLLFALNKSEALYYTAFTDDEGIPLSTNCNYRIEGKDLDAGWWSITVYGPDQFLVPNKQNRYSYTNDELISNEKKNYVIHLSSNPKEGNWLPTGKQGSFNLVLRLYNPAPSIYKNLATCELPRIIKEGCR